MNRIERGRRPDPQRFRDAWLRIRWVKNVAAELGMAYDDVNHWARVFRAEGVDLPTKRRRPGPEGPASRGPLSSPAMVDTFSGVQGTNGSAPPRGTQANLVAARHAIERQRQRQMERAKSSIVRDLSSTDDERIERAMQRLSALERLKGL